MQEDIRPPIIDQKQQTVASPSELVVSCELMVELIDMLLNACTKYAGDERFSHEHDLFDSVDRDVLMSLRSRLTNSN